MHQTEKHLLACAFCADTLAGLESMNQQRIKSGVRQDLRQRLVNRTRKGKKIVPIWQTVGIAASVLLVLGIRFVVFRNQEPEIQKNVVVQIPPKKEIFADSSGDLAYQKPKTAQNSTVVETSKFESSVLANESVEDHIDSEDIAPQIVQEEMSAPVAQPASEEVRELEEVVVSAKAKIERREITGAVAMKKDTDDKIIRGVVRGEDGLAFPGVAVEIKGKKRGTQSDVDGNFVIKAAEGDILRLSFVGTESQEIKIENPTLPLEVELKDDNKTLSEVVVVGYGVDEKPEEHAQQDWASFKKYVKQNLQYPPQAAQKKVRGRVIAKVKVLANGQIDKIKIIRKLGYGCDEETIRLIERFPWKSSRNGQTFRVGIRFGR